MINSLVINNNEFISLSAALRQKNYASLYNVLQFFLEHQWN